jgi:hypothetical protein
MSRSSRVFMAAALPALLCAGSVQAAVVSVSSAYGDSDCFGLGVACTEGASFPSLGGVFFADNRSAADLASAPETDIWKAGSRSWTHSYATDGTALAATFQFLVAGMADIGVVSLLIDGAVAATYDFSPSNSTVRSLSVSVPLSAIDGSTTFSLSGPGGDGYILDAAQLSMRFEVNDVPEPGSLLLAGLALAGLAGSRRRAA